VCFFCQTLRASFRKVDAVGELSVHICEDAITIVSEIPIRLPKRWLHPELVTAFCKANYNMQGTVSYQTWLAGVFAGLALVVGPDGVPFSCAAEVKQPVLDVEAAGTDNIIMANSGEAPAELVPGEIEVARSTGELDLVVDGIPHKFAQLSLEPAKELQSISADEVGTVESVLAGTEEQLGGLTPSRSPENETIVPSAETPAAVGETIVPVSESPAAVSEETRGLTPPSSPEPGVVSP